MIVYDGDDDVSDLKQIAQNVIDKFNYDSVGKFKKIKVNGLDALEFTFKFTNSDGSYEGRAFAVYQHERSFGPPAREAHRLIEADVERKIADLTQRRSDCGELARWRTATPRVDL